MNIANSIFSGDRGWVELNELLLLYKNSGIYILVDENTFGLCLPLLQQNAPLTREAFIIQIPGGEAHKTISGIEKVWQKLTTGKAMRSSLLICLGGGVITDVGGFAAATFKRGMDFIHIPTTLLAMVDASLGGKTGINLDSVKNQVGVFAQPRCVFVFTDFLEALPERQKLSGYAEMLKHAMIDDESHYNEILQIKTSREFCSEELILKSAAVKIKIVESDPSEGGIRKVLNLGHTIGHAVETYSQKNDAVPLLHGEAVAIGLICESFIAMRMLGLPEKELKKLVSLINLHYSHYSFKPGSASELLVLMAHDKKNTESTRLNFSLIRKIGDPVFDQYPDESLIRESLHFYQNLGTEAYN